MELRLRIRRLLCPIVQTVFPKLHLPADEIRTVLLVKSGRLNYALAVLDILEKRFPGAKVMVLTEEREFEQLANDQRVSRLLFYQNLRRFPSLYWETRRLNCDVKVVLFTKDDTYEKFTVLSMLLAGRKMLVYNEHLESIYCRWWDLQWLGFLLQRISLYNIARQLLRWAATLVIIALAPFVFAYLALWGLVAYTRFRSRRLNRARESLSGAFVTEEQ